MKTHLLRSMSLWLITIPLASALALTANVQPAAAAARVQPEERLGEALNRAMRADGPFFTPEEQAVISRKCGYAPGEWDGHDVNVSDGVYTCKNGRRVDDPEMRPLLSAAMPRIERRVESVMEQPAVRAAIDAFAAEAAEAALKALAEGSYRVQSDRDKKR